MIGTFLLLLQAASFDSALSGLAQDRDPEGVAHFETKIRPVLVEKCYRCHSAGAEKLKGDLRLDSRAGVLKGGHSGPAIIPGKPEESLLLKAIRHADPELKMPPKEKLDDRTVADFEAWIRRGAPDPRTGPVKKDEKPLWSLQPIREVAPPAVRNEAPSTSLGASWVRTPVDRFILAKLEEKGLSPSPEADRRTLLRRVTFDLTGLPPTPEEIASADPYERVVERLLASPHYGERWGRHWLDAVRYGESHGYERNHLRPNAWPYRDYVIRAFNEDKPYARFVEEQLAGDLVGKGDPDVEVATGFLVAGVHDDVSSPEETLTRMQRANDLDDIVSTTGAAFLGLTVGCARCHDHKFDPIPQRDYYRLVAVFAGVRHEERPIAPPAEIEAIGKERAEVEVRLRSLRVAVLDLEARAREAVLRAQGIDPVFRPAVSPLRNVERFTPVRARFVRLVVQSTRDGLEPCIDELEVYAPGSEQNLALMGKAAASSAYPNAAIHQVRHLNDGKYGNDHSWISHERGGGWAQIELAESALVDRVIWSRDSVEKPKFQDRLAGAYRVDLSEDGASWRTVASGGDRAAAAEKIPPEKLVEAMAPGERQARADALAGQEPLRKRLASLVPRAAYIGRFTPPDPVHVLSRGDVMKRGEAVAPGALSELPGLPPDLGAEPRLALARWIADPRNPLAARVLVNRAWQHHFGAGLSTTPSDFGRQGDPPSHAELLDWLAREFSAGGGRLKPLHRLIVLSAAYRQSSAVRPEAEAVDTANRLLWRMPLRRLEAEPLRDAVLAVSGALRRDAGGPGFPLFKYSVNNIAFYEPLAEQGPETWRRAVYAQAPRAYRDELMATFDAPENVLRSPRRDVTTTPLQALSLLHAPFVVQQAGHFAARVRREAGENPEAQVARAFLLAFGRAPGEAERRDALELASRRGLTLLCRALFNANEFLTY